VNGPFSGEALVRVAAPWLFALPLVPAVLALLLRRRNAPWIARGAPWLALVGPVAALALAPSAGLLHAPGPRVIAIGFFALRLDLAADRATALVALALALVAALRPSARTLGLVALATAVTVVDDRMLAALGWSVLVVLGARAFGARLTSTLAVAAAALLFWGLGGAFTPAGYAPELAPRVVALVGGDARAVAASAPDDDDDDEVAVPDYAAGEHGTLSVRAFPGAELHVDGARAPYARTPPFEGQPLAAGFHAFRIHPGQAYDDYVVSQLRVDPDQRVVLIAVGSTTSAADARDAMQARLGEHAPFAEAFASRRWRGIGLGAVIAALLVVAALGAVRGPLFACAALGLLVPFLAIVGPSPLAALVAFALAVALSPWTARADALLAVGAALAGAPLPAALALAGATGSGERRAAAIATLVPRAVIAATLLGDASPLGRCATLGFVGASALVLAAPRAGTPGVSAWATTFLVGLAGASALASTRPSGAAFVLALAVTIVGWIPAARWARGRRARVRAWVRTRERARAFGVRVGTWIARLEGAP
jgi:hypothetical protein